MSTYAPTVTVLPQNAIQVVGTQVNYEQIQSSIGTTLYKFIGLYQQATTLEQIKKVTQLAKYLPDGRIVSYDYFSPPDVNQRQPIINVDYSDTHFIFDAAGALWLNLAPLENVFLVFSLQESIVSDKLPGETNFEMVQKELLPDIFNNYTTNIL